MKSQKIAREFLSGKNLYMNVFFITAFMVASLPVHLLYADELAHAEFDVIAKDKIDLRRMIGQMIMIGFPGTKASEEWPARIINLINSGKIGGVLLMSGNIESPQQLKQLTESILSAGKPVSPFIAVDQEGGLVQRLSPRKGFLGLPSAAQMASTIDPRAAQELYRHEALQLAACGINVNLGPVVDLNLNPTNPVIGRVDRSYGDTTKIILPYARAFIKAYGDLGILAAAKHFPGHGSSISDPHDATTNLNGLWQKKELEPFKALFANRGTSMVMVGHLILDGYSDHDDVPASLSRRAIANKLRRVLGFRGIVVTDDLDMSAIRDHYTMEEAFVRAIAAGNDIVIQSNNRAPDPTIVDRVTDAIVAAVEDGRISRLQIRRSYKRIIAAKFKFRVGNFIDRDNELRKEKYCN